MPTNPQVADHFVSKDTGDLYGSNLFVQGDVLYSFGLHWPIAVRQGDVVVINATKRSKSSTVHVGLITSALTLAGQAFRMSTMDEVKQIIKEHEDDS